MSDTIPSARRRWTAHLLLVAVTVVWGTTFPLVKAALREVSPLLFNFLRMSLAAAVLLTVNVRRLRQLTLAQMRPCVLAGFLLALGYELQTAGLALTTPSKSAFLTGLVVVIVVLLGLLPVLRVAGTPPPSVASLTGALMAFVGIVLLTGGEITPAAWLTGMHRGEWLTLGCAVAFALHLLTLAHSAAQLSARVLGTLQIVFAAGFLGLKLPLEAHPHLHWTPTVWAALGVTSVLATAVAFTIQSWVQQYLPASHTALILTLEPVFAAVTSLVFFGERLGTRALMGAALILCGIVLTELGPTALSQAAILPLDP